jgi:hypothetical protein
MENKPEKVIELAKGKNYVLIKETHKEIPRPLYIIKYFDQAGKVNEFVIPTNVVKALHADYKEEPVGAEPT